MQKPKCVILVGLPYSGKTYSVPLIKGWFNLADDYVVASIDNGLSDKEETYHNKFIKEIEYAGVYLADKLMQVRDEDKDCVVDMCNLTPQIRFYIKLLLPGHEVIAVNFNVTNALREAYKNNRPEKIIPTPIVKLMEETYIPAKKSDEPYLSQVHEWPSSAKTEFSRKTPFLGDM